MEIENHNLQEELGASPEVHLDAAKKRLHVPEGYVLVPIEPTPEWVRRFEPIPEYQRHAEQAIREVIATAPKL